MLGILLKFAAVSVGKQIKSPLALCKLCLTVSRMNLRDPLAECNILKPSAGYELHAFDPFLLSVIQKGVNVITLIFYSGVAFNT